MKSERDYFRAANTPCRRSAETREAGPFLSQRPVDKELWQQLQPLIHAFTPSGKGAPRSFKVRDEAALNDVLFVLHAGISRKDLPKFLGCVRGMNCWRRPCLPQS